MMALAAISLAAISEIVKMVTVVVAGFWAAWTFHKLEKVRAAELQNRRTEADIQKSRVDQQEGMTRLLRQQPQLAIDFDVTETPANAGTYKSFLGVCVTVKNEGEQNLNIEFGLSPLTVCRKIFRKNGEETFEIQTFSAPVFLAGQEDVFRERILRAGQKRRMALAVLGVTEPGAYLLQFRVAYYRFPFDGENRETADKGTVIHAIEQTIYFAKGKSAELAPKQ